MNRWIPLALVGILIAPFLSASGAPEQQEALKRLERAVAKANIFDLPSFQMTATVQIENRDSPLAGTYQLLWHGPEQWREEISLPGYTEVQVGGKGTVWIQRSTDFLPLAVYQLHLALGFGSQAGANPGRF